MKGEISIGIVGTQFMGRAHTNAWLDVWHCFDLPRRPAPRAACDVDESGVRAFAARYGWQTTETSWKDLVERDDIEVVDICTPNNLHMPIAVAAAKKGKHILCEKPIALNADEARRMLDAAREAGVRHMTGFNYRRVPAICLAKSLIDQGKIGRVYHFNAVYYQDWLADPAFPLVWRHDAKVGGSGAHGDMNAHIVDLARFLVGEFEAVCCAQEIFIKERPKKDGSGMGKVTADDTAYIMARFQTGAMGAFLVSRLATGRKNFLRIELFGSEGAISFNLERLNELEYYSRTDAGPEQGFRTIMVTEGSHPYLNLWWPPGHIIGWEHTFIHEIGDLLLAIDKGVNVHADFYDGLRCQQVIDAAVKSAEDRKWIDVPRE